MGDRLTLRGVEMIGVRTNQSKRLALIRLPADDCVSERLVVEALTVEQLWLTRKTLVEADEARRAELLPRLLLAE